jgi:hypothetical protein
MTLGPSPEWERGTQRRGRREMLRRLHFDGLAAAVEYRKQFNLIDNREKNDMPRDLKAIVEDIDQLARTGLYLMDGEMDEMTVRSVELNHWIGLIDFLLEYRAGHEPDPDCEAALRTYRCGLAAEHTRLGAMREEVFAAPEEALVARLQELGITVAADREVRSALKAVLPGPEQQRKAFGEDDSEPVELTEVQKQQVNNMTADIPEDDPDRDWLINFAELVVTAERNDEGIEALKADIAGEQAELQRKPH